MEDFRVKTSWRTSRKRRRLERVLGRDAVLAVVDLWSYCAEERTDGDLSGLSNAAIAAEAGWEGDPDAWIRELTMPDFELLDGTELNYRVHDWEQHNPYVAGHTNRSEQARKAGKASGKARRKKRKKTDNSNSIEQTVQSSSTDANPGSDPGSGSRSRSDRSITVDQLFAMLQEWPGWQPGTALTKRAKELAAELEWAVTPEEMKKGRKEAEEEARRNGKRPNLGFLLSIIVRYRRNGGPPPDQPSPPGWQPAEELNDD